MATTYTTNVGLGCPSYDQAGWDTPLRDTIALLDSLAPVGALGCRAREIPSTSLYVAFAPGSFRSSTGAVVGYAGATLAVPTAATTRYWLDDAGTLQSGSAWPAGPYVPLSTVVAGTSTITSIVDARLAFGSLGTGPRLAVTSQAGTYAILPADGLVSLDATAAAFTATLPSASANPGMVVRVAKVDVSANAVTIATVSSQTINGAATLSLAAQWDGKTLVSDGTNWVAF
jgi:hypothetical protein